MENLFYPVTVDILERHLPPIIYVKQADTARGLAITLTARGEPYAIPTGGSYMLRVRKPDKTAAVLYAENKGNILYANLTEQALAVAGMAAAEAAIYGANGKIISSFVFGLHIEEAACTSDKITSSDEYDALARLLLEIAKTEAARAEAETARATAEAARQAAETSRETAENSRTAAETTRAEAETARQQAETLRAQEESQRAANETARNTAEAARAQAETERATAEADRSKAEQERASAENLRATAETSRATAEDTRENQEADRQAAEAARAAEYASFMETYGDAYKLLNEAAASAAEIKNIYSKMQITLYFDETGGICYTENETEQGGHNEQ